MKHLWRTRRLYPYENNNVEQRRATWLELFYDLVFVAAIAELSGNLNRNVSVSGFCEFVALFIPIWWCWVGATYYATRFALDDIGDRLLALLQMAIVVTLAVNIHHGLEESSVGFALCYGTMRCILIIQYLLAGYQAVAARPLTIRYAQGFGIGVCFWLVSIMVPIPWRFILWALGLVVDFATPFFLRKLTLQAPPNISHISERLGLLVIIVLGESVVAVVRGVVEREWNPSAIATSILALSLAFSLWWIYFDTVDLSPLEAIKLGRPHIGLLWLYIHLPLAVGLTATGVGVEHIVSRQAEVTLPNAERWLFCGAVALCLTALAAIDQMVCRQGTDKSKTFSLSLLGGAGLSLMLAAEGSQLSTLTLMALVTAICAIQVCLNLRRIASRAERDRDPNS
jgi:low temperature requirement protein LtrA